jgi:hypothetical protein
VVPEAVVTAPASAAEPAVSEEDVSRQVENRAVETDDVDAEELARGIWEILSMRKGFSRTV